MTISLMVGTASYHQPAAGSRKVHPLMCMESRQIAWKQAPAKLCLMEPQDLVLGIKHLGSLVNARAYKGHLAPCSWQLAQDLTSVQCLAALNGAMINSAGACGCCREDTWPHAKGHDHAMVEREGNAWRTQNVDPESRQLMARGWRLKDARPAQAIIEDEFRWPQYLFNDLLPSPESHQGKHTILLAWQQCLISTKGICSGWISVVHGPHPWQRCAPLIWLYH